MSQDEAKELKKYYKGLPSAFVRIGPKGYVFPKYENLMEQLTFFYNMQLQKSDTFVVSFPRSDLKFILVFLNAPVDVEGINKGTTMTQELVWLIGNNLDYNTASSKYLCERYIFAWLHRPAPEIEEYQQKKCKNIERYITRIKWPIENWTDTSNSRYIMSHMSFSMLPPDTLDTAKVVYVARNPLDVAVSMYHLYKLIKMYEFIGDFKTFWYFFSRGSSVGTPYFAHVKQAWELRHHPNMLFLFYEEITKDLPTAIRQVSTFLNKNYSDEQIMGLCEHMKFENFQNNKAVNLDYLKEFDVHVPHEQSFIRKGKTGGWRDYFDEAMTKEAFSWIKDNLRDTDLRFPELDGQPNNVVE